MVPAVPAAPLPLSDRARVLSRAWKISRPVYGPDVGADRSTEAGVPPTLGAARAANGSATTGAPTTAPGWKAALPVERTPPWTKIPEAVMLALPLAETAVLEEESTSSTPAMFSDPLPETV